MNQVTDPNKGDMLRSIFYISIYIFVISGTAFFLLPDLWYLWGLLVIVGLLILVNWHQQKTAYRCPKCEHDYEISFLVDLTAPHGLDKDGAWLYIKCPSCKQRSKTKVLKKLG